MKRKITEIPCLAHYNSNLQNIITTDASIKGLGATLWQKQENGDIKPISYASRFLSDAEKKYAINELELLAVVWGLEHFRLYIYGKPITILTDHKSLEPLLKRNRSNKTYSARLTRWLDRLAHFDININHIAGKHLQLTDYLSRNPISQAEQIELYDEEYVINNISLLNDFIKEYGSLSHSFEEANKNGKRAENSDQSQLRIAETKLLHNTNDHTTANLPSKKVLNSITSSKMGREMDWRIVDRLEKSDKSPETQQLIRRWREIQKPGKYRPSGGKSLKYNPPKSLRAERDEIQNKLWDRIIPTTPSTSQSNARSEETTDQLQSQYTNWTFQTPTPNYSISVGQQNYTVGFIDNSEECHRRRKEFQKESMETYDPDSELSSDAESLTTPAINFARYPGSKTVHYVKMGAALHIQDDPTWNLAETIRSVDKKFSTDLELLMKETTNDENLIKTLVCIERNQHDQIPNEYNQMKKRLSTRFGLVFLDDKIVIPKNLRPHIINLLHKGHPAINKMTSSAALFWWPKMQEAIQKKCESCIPCKMTGKSIKPNIPMTEVNFLPPLSEPNTEIQLDFIGPIRFKHRKFYILLSMDRYSKWPAAAICKTPNAKSAEKFIEQYTLLNGHPQILRTDKGTAFTSRQFRKICKSKNIRLIYRTPYIHTPTGLVERGVKTLKDTLRANLYEGLKIDEALDRTLMVMRTTEHTKHKQTPFERHYGRKPQTELTNFLGYNDKTLNVLAKPDTLEVFSFQNSKGEVTDQLIMKAPRKLKVDVSKKYPFQFLEKKHTKGKFESAYGAIPQTAISGTDHTVTTDKNRTIHRKNISNPVYLQNPYSRQGEGPRDRNGRFTKKNETKEISRQEEESEPEEDEIIKPQTIGVGRARPKLIRNRPLLSVGNSPTGQSTSQTDQPTEDNNNNRTQEDTELNGNVSIKSETSDNIETGGKKKIEMKIEQQQM